MSEKTTKRTVQIDIAGGSNTASPVVRTLANDLKNLNQQAAKMGLAGESSIVGLLKGGAAASAVALGSRFLTGISDAMIEFRRGGIGAADAVAKAMQSIPILGDINSFGASLHELFTGAKAEIAVIDAQSASISRNTKFTREEADRAKKIYEDWAVTVRELNSGIRLMTAGPGASLVIGAETAMDATRRRATAQIEETRKKYDAEIKTLREELKAIPMTGDEVRFDPEQRRMRRMKFRTPAEAAAVAAKEAEIQRNERLRDQGIAGFEGGRDAALVKMLDRLDAEMNRAGGKQGRDSAKLGARLMGGIRDSAIEFVRDVAPEAVGSFIESVVDLAGKEENARRMLEDIGIQEAEAARDPFRARELRETAEARRRRLELAQIAADLSASPEQREAARKGLGDGALLKLPDILQGVREDLKQYQNQILNLLGGGSVDPNAVLNTVYGPLP